MKVAGISLGISMENGASWLEMDIPKSFKDVPYSFMDIHLSSHLASFSMGIPRNIPGNIPRLARTLSVRLR